MQSQLISPGKKPSIDYYIPALAHELRNPLTNIQLAVEFLKSAIKDDQLSIFPDIILRSTTRINELIIELLKYDQEKIKLEKCTIHQLLDEILELTKDRLDLKNISVRKNYKQDCELLLNKPEMKIALTNVIVNAIDAMIAGKGELKLATSSIKSKYAIIIEDNGCGISKANLKNIFKPYFTNKSAGMGIGLTAAHHIFRSNDVRVNVESTEGKGTRFILSFDKKTSLLEATDSPV